MTTTHKAMQPNPTDRFTSKLRDFYILTKPEVNLLILMTTSTGYYLASRGPFQIVGLINTLVGTLAGRQRYRNPESVDGTGLGRSDAPHRKSSAAFGQTEAHAKHFGSGFC